MNKKVEIEVSRLRETYNDGDAATRSLLESLYGSEIFQKSDEDMYKSLLNLIENYGSTELLVWTEKRVELDAVKKPAVAPWAVEANGKVVGVAVPIINKVFYFDDVPENDEEMNWDDAMAFAKERGRTLPSKRELHLCYFFKDEINAIAEAAGHPDFLSGWIWSSTEFFTSNAWYVYFNSGYVSNNNKYNTGNVVRPVADI